MKYIFSLLNLLFLQIFSLKEIKPKLCINCKYFFSNFKTDKFGRCLLFQKEENNIYKLVNGNHENNNEYHFCATAREIENMCGKEGKMYKKRYIKKGI
jgi:hypothetical protein